MPQLVTHFTFNYWTFQQYLPNYCTSVLAQELRTSDHWSHNVKSVKRICAFIVYEMNLWLFCVLFLQLEGFAFQRLYR